MQTNELTLFLDTNSLLHYPPIRDVDWTGACGCSAVRLILCLQVIHELDEKKDDSRLGDRASRTIKEVKVIRSAGGAVREGVTLEVFNYEVRATDFPESLSFDSKDDRIVLSVKKFLEKNPAARVAIYTEDMGMSLRCEANGIAVVEPDTAKRLENPQAEHERKYRLAITELNELKNRAPVLELVVSAGEATEPRKDRLDFEITPPQTELDLEAELQAYQRHNNLFPMQKQDIASGVPFPRLPHDHDAVERFNGELEKHLNEYREWLKIRQILGNIKAHRIDLSVWITNSGLAPADDLDIVIEVGEPVGLVFEASSEEAESLTLPEPPKAPKRPTQFFTDLGHLLRPPRAAYSLPNLDRVWSNKARVEKKEATDSYRIAFSTRRLKHSESDHVGNLILVLQPDSIRPFQMEYRITAANLPKAIEGAIPVIVRKKE
jgi:hypothetical protein